ncbi:MAG: hypothetical protein ISS63_16495 [Desulfobacteraceae bacterium]|nr:hypothetical protein [Desulfobacteraceae bacterium]
MAIKNYLKVKNIYFQMKESDNKIKVHMYPEKIDLSYGDLIVKVGNSSVWKDIVKFLFYVGLPEHILDAINYEYTLLDLSNLGSFGAPVTLDVQPMNPDTIFKTSDATSRA